MLAFENPLACGLRKPESEAERGRPSLCSPHPARVPAPERACTSPSASHCARALLFTSLCACAPPRGSRRARCLRKSPTCKRRLSFLINRLVFYRSRREGWAILSQPDRVTARTAHSLLPPHRMFWGTRRLAPSWDARTDPRWPPAAVSRKQAGTSRASKSTTPHPAPGPRDPAAGARGPGRAESAQILPPQPRLCAVLARPADAAL